MKPKRIFLVRHGESESNVDKENSRDVPDYAFELSAKGRQQAYNVGVELKGIIGEESVQFYVSPYWRTRQTYLGIRRSIPGARYYEDPRLREQEWPRFNKGEIPERDEYGTFYYRFD